MTLYMQMYIFFFFNDTATTEIYTLSLHDALPIYEDVVGGSNAPPKGRVEHRLLMPDVLDLNRRDVVEDVHRAVHPVGIDPVLECGRRVTRDDRRAHDPVGPRDRSAAGIQPGGHAVVIVGTIKFVLHILFARPHPFHRALHVLPDAHGLGHIVVLEPPTESPAQQVVVHHHLLERQARHPGGGRLCPGERLRAGPDLAAVPPHVDSAVHRLHGGVGQERDLVHLVDSLGCTGERPGGIALLARHHARLLRRFI